MGRENYMRFRDRLRKFFFSWRYGRGNAYYCVFCGRSAARFLPTGVNRPVLKRLDVVGAGRRKNAKCPHCLSSDRARLILLYLKTQTSAFDAPTRLLDIGPDRRLAATLSGADNVDYVCGSLNPEPIEMCNPMRLDVTALPFESDQFDIVLCSHVMEYVRQDELGFREIRRVLRQGGSAVLQAPIAQRLDKTREGWPGMSRRESIRHFGHSGNVRLYGLDYEDKLTQAGFRVKRRSPFVEMWVADIHRHGLNPREELYIAAK